MQSATLLGSLVISQFWQLALAQAAPPAEQRPPVSAYLDDAQAFLHLDADLGEALEQSRSLNVAWHLAHQHRRQMPSDLLAGIDANTRNKIIFTLERADATVISVGSGLSPEDFTQLPPYAIYTSVLSQGQQTGWFSGRALPPPKVVANPEAVLRESQTRYGADPTTVPQQHPGPNPALPNPDDEPIGRKERGGP